MPSPKFESTPKNTTTTTTNYCRKSHSTEDAYIDLPPDSFWVSKGDEHDWFDRNAIVKRTPSRKLTYSSCPTHHFNQENITPHRSSLSFEYNKHQKPPFIGLPLGGQKPSFPTGHLRQRKPVTGGVYFQRSRSEPRGRLAVSEPDSPQVNCLGKVETKKHNTSKVVKKTGFWQSIASVLRTGFRFQSSVSSPVGTICDNMEVTKERTGPVEVKSQQPSLAGLRRLTSGRRSSEIIEFKRE